MALSEEEKAEKERRKEDRAKKQAAEFAKTLEAPRPGVRRISPEEIRPQEDLNTGKERLELSGILWLSPEQLQENPYNDYPPLSGEELMELAKDIAEKGVLVPLIVRVSEDVLICGHNRRRASIEAKEPKVPVQRILRLLSEEEEREIMKSENDRRRGGNWSKEKKVEFIREHFGERLEEDNRGAHKKQSGKNFSEVLDGNDQKFTEPLIESEAEIEKSSTNHESIRESLNKPPGKNFTEVLEKKPASLAAEIEEKSRGKITKGTADRLLSDMRKEKKKGKPAAIREKEKSSLSEKDRKRGEKLALHLKTLKNTRSLLEDKLIKVKEEEKKALKELKSIGQPELFGVE